MEDVGLQPRDGDTNFARDEQHTRRHYNLVIWNHNARNAFAPWGALGPAK